MRKPDDPIASTDPGASSGSGNGESFYGRWSRRKNQARREPEPVPVDVSPAADAVGTPVPDPVQAPPAPPSGSADAEPEAPVLTDADMPPLESLGEDDDYSGFMSPGVSEGLRNQALRKLFMSSKFNVVDGLNDYDEDFRSFEALGDIITSDMRHQMEVQAQRAKQKAEEEARSLLAEEDDTARASEEEAGADDRVQEVEGPVEDGFVSQGTGAQGTGAQGAEAPGNKLEQHASAASDQLPAGNPSVRSPRGTGDGSGEE